MDFPLFTVGDKAPEVAAMQRRLLHPVVDGVYTDQFAARVRGFQFVWGLPVTGDVDEKTFHLLMGDQ